MKMLRADTRAKQWALGIFLAVIAGYLDGYGLRFLGTFVSFMSGNTTMTGMNAGEGNFGAALPAAVAIAFFVAGSFSGNLLAHSRFRHSHRIILGAIAGLLGAAAFLDRRNLANAAFEIAVLSLAMGMTNPALAQIGAESVSLTFMTGTLTRIGGHLASAAGQDSLPGAQGPWDSHLARARIDSSLWLGFLAGAGVSGFVGADLRRWALLPPCFIMIALSVLSERAVRISERTMPAKENSGALGPAS